MKVAMISFFWGEYCARLASGLAQQGVSVLLMIPEWEITPHMNKLDPRVQVQPIIMPRLRRPHQVIQAIAAVVRYVRRFKPDLVHLQQGYWWFNFTLPLLSQYPMVLTVHDPVHHVGDRDTLITPQFVMEWGYSFARQWIVHASQLKSLLVDRMKIPSDGVHVVPMTAHGDASIQPEVEEEGNILLFFGRIWAYKGLDYLIRAEPLITAALPGTKILIAGQGEDFAPYREMMVNPENFIVHNEFIPEEKAAEYFRRASVVVLPYIDASQSAVVPFAYTFGKPVVATTVGGLPDIVEDGITGLLVPPRDLNALAEACIRLMQDRPLREQMGSSGRRKVMTENAPEAVAQKTFEIYQRTLALGSKKTPEPTEEKVTLPSTK